MLKTPKLIIWDFDGVIADTEKLWIKTDCELLNEIYHLDWSFEKTADVLWGLSLKSKKEVLGKLGIVTDETFWNEVDCRDFALLKNGIELSPGIANIFAHHEVKQCIATGGTPKRTQFKIDAVGLQNRFAPEHIFTATMVENGKPDPALFLLAAEKMGEQPQDCVVIEDSIAGLTAGLRAKMTTIAFVGGELNNTPDYIAKVEALGIKYICQTMAEVENLLNLKKAS